MSSSARTGLVWLLTLAICVPSICTIGCDDKYDEFRETIADDVASGVKTILDAIVDGIFAMLEPDESSDGSTGDSTESSG